MEGSTTAFIGGHPLLSAAKEIILPMSTRKGTDPIEEHVAR